ncbi:MAG: transcription-repair coupling factor [Bacilli bacterium]|nr:transcription-repair coupling factor [Bacilli bacterium]
MKFFDNVFDIDNNSDYSVSGLNNELVCINIYNAFIRNNKGFLVVTSSTFEANNLYQSLLNYTDKVLFFPMDDFLTSEAIAISPEFKAERINTLNTLLSSNKYIVVTNLMGALRYLPTKSLWEKSNITLKKGIDVDREKLLTDLYNIGYERETIVNGTGKVGVRGYVIDIFPASYEDAVRIEFWGDTIDSIKYFDVDTQLSLKEIDEVTISPFTEFIIDEYKEDVDRRQKYLKYYSKEVSQISEYLDNPVVYYYDYGMILNSYSLLIDSIMDYDKDNKGEIETSYMHEITSIKSSLNIYYYHFDDHIGKSLKNYKFDFSSVNKYNGNYEEIKKDLIKYIGSGYTVILCIDNKDTAKRIVKYLEIDDIILSDEKNIVAGKINLINKNISNGFIYSNYVVLGKKDLFDIKEEKTKYKSKYKLGSKVHAITNLEVGDYVVHEMFGIGIYQGLFTIEKNGMKKDYVKLEYAGGDSLYIPVENIDRISKYTGKEGVGVNLNSLSNDNWKKKKGKVREKLASIAGDLIMVSAEREITPGYAFSRDDENQAVFDSEFIYMETPDQIKAISLIKEEMEKPKPMDMLLCGDVGYGKTEVAFRAMFKAINDGKQVAYLCPTTILSSQQYESAKARFSTFPVNIGLINRFVDKSKQTKVLEDLKDGKIDILFGTHRLLSEDVVFKDLGLLVVDEEQRFGVTHKEKIKQLKANVDVLTLSATPIPRTLQMSMTGIRSLALIETPPKERYPIQTYVLEESNLVIKDAIYKELSRDGQVFILFNSVERIEEKVREIKRLVPEANVDYAHGKMTKDQLEKKMNDFIQGKYNVLVCTTIIETGIDIPNVNTLIIIDADRFGLSQLYQIRGRIGRSNKIGYAYLMYSKNKFLTDTAIKRLDTIKEFTELGSGFKIAMRDLSIRGAGDILGREQSGFIDTIGIDLYLKMLNEAIRKAKGEVICEEEDTTKKDIPLISVSTHIDDNYVMDSELKIAIHKKINEVDSYDSFCSVKEELEDRFGKLSEDLEIYMYEEWFEKIARNLGITEVVDGKNSVDITLPKELSSQIDGEKLFHEAYNVSRNFRFTYKNNSIHVILDKVKLEGHYLMYLIGILIKINGIINNKK